MVAESKPIECIAVIVTSESGDKQTNHPHIQFNSDDSPVSNTLKIFPSRTKQVMQGVGTSFTQSSAFVLAHLPEASRNEVMEAIYGESGANFPIARTHIGACDFCVDGRYSYAEVADDKTLEHFSIAVDYEPFDTDRFPDLEQPRFTLLPMIHQANLIKANQADNPVNIIASAWTAPPWMKTINDWYIKVAANEGSLTFEINIINCFFHVFSPNWNLVSHTLTQRV